MAPTIPNRWIPYKACGKVIEGTRIICFKVPLRKSVQVGKSEIKEIWDIQTLRETIPNLGAVIDLTNTSRYYDPREMQAAGILHKKILMPGREIPPEDQVQLFMDTVDEFLGNDCESVIGVHCTHGLNRTGYMVCRYMRDRLNIPAKTAIKRFEVARGYQIERENYIADLLGEKPPPPFEGKHTKIKPIGDENTIAKDEDVEEHTLNSQIREREKRQKREKRSLERRRSKKNEITNWRTEDRSTTTSWHNWVQKKEKKRNRESNEHQTQDIEADKLKRKIEKKLAKKIKKKMKEKEAKTLEEEEVVRKRKERKILKRKRRREALQKNKDKTGLCTNKELIPN